MQYQHSEELRDAVKKLNPFEKMGVLLHSTPEKKVDKPFHEMTGRAARALQEVHIFLADLNPLDDGDVGKEKLARCREVTRLMNQHHEGKTDSYKLMKPCHLALWFENAGRYHSVMQSARYILTNSIEETIAEAYKDAELFCLAGFDVLRVKIESSMHGINGIPETVEDLTKHKEYFEHHIKVGRKDAKEDKVLTEKELKDQAEQLRHISELFTAIFGVPIPLSYNHEQYDPRHEHRGQQRFLNIRFRDCGRAEALARVELITHYINEKTIYKVLKTIDELVWYDDYPELDKGWIDFDDKMSAVFQLASEETIEKHLREVMGYKSEEEQSALLQTLGMMKKE